MNRSSRMKVLYDSLPTIECQGRCHVSCGPIFVNTFEWNAIGKPAAGKTIDCPMLVDRRCSVYQARPLICRLWGVVDEMKCPWGCVPSRRMEPEEIQRVMDEWRAISGEIKSLVDIESVRATLAPAFLNPNRRFS